MTDERFWELIRTVDVPLLEKGEVFGAVEPLQEALEDLDVKELEAFEDVLSRKLHDLDGEEYARNAGESGRSEDGFLYARCFVVACGREHYEAVLKDATRMAATADRWCEPLLDVHVVAWCAITGKDESQWEHVPAVRCETASNAAKWPSLARRR